MALQDKDKEKTSSSVSGGLRKIFLVVLKILISSTLLYFIISKTGINNIFSILKGINILSFLLAILLYIISIYISSIRWLFLLPEGFKTGRLFSLCLIGSFFNTLLPGIIGGDAVKAYYLSNESQIKSKRGSSGPEARSPELKDKSSSLAAPRSSLVIAIASVFMDRYIGFAALISIGMAVFPFGLRYFRGSYIEWILPVIVMLFVSGSFLVFGLKIGKRFGMLTELYGYFSIYIRQRAVIVKVFLLSVIVQVIGIMTVYTLSLGLNINVPLLPLFIFIPVISTITSIPISISGIGVREASFVLLFGFLGLSPIQSTAISFAWFFSVATGSLTGLVEYLRYKRQ